VQYIHSNIDEADSSANKTEPGEKPAAGTKTEPENNDKKNAEEKK
jgi:hypothetical protein